MILCVCVCHQVISSMIALKPVVHLKNSIIFIFTEKFFLSRVNCENSLTDHRYLLEVPVSQTCTYLKFSVFCNLYGIYKQLFCYCSLKVKVYGLHPLSCLTDYYLVLDLAVRPLITSSIRLRQRTLKF